MSYIEDIFGLDDVEACKVYETVTEVRREVDESEFREKAVKKLENKYNNDMKILFGGIITTMYDENARIELNEDETQVLVRSLIDNVREEIANNLDDYVKRILD